MRVIPGMDYRVVSVALTAVVLGIALMTGGCDAVRDRLTPEGVAAAGAVVTRAVLSPEQEATIRAGCQQGRSLLDVAKLPRIPKVVYETAVYPAAYCDQMLSLPVGQVPPTTDANTPSWFSRVMSVLPDVIRVAGILVR